MSVAVCRSPAAGFESILALPTAALSATSSRTWMLASPAAENEHEHEKQDLISKTQEEEGEFVNDDNHEAERPPGEFDIWSSIQAQKAKQEAQRQDEPYVHPLMRRSSGLLSQKSLEICTESLGSETGSDEFFSSDEETDFFSLGAKKEQVVQQEQEEEADEVEEESEFGHVAARRANGRKELATVNYHCSISRRSSKSRSFPPPLPSISRRDGPCLQMRPHRRDGRLVVEAVAVPSQNYLHAERQNGRLLLSFINTTSSSYNAPDTETETAYQTQVDELKEEEAQMQAEELEDEEAMMMEVEEEEEEEVEVVDRGTVVEVKVSTNPQQNSIGAAAVKVHRSSIVINKFVGMPAVDNQITNDNHHEIFTAATAAAPPLSPVRRLSPTTTTAAAAAVAAASSLSAFPAVDGSHSSATDNKLLFTSRRRNREELLHDMRRCSQLKKPLFIWEPCCIATSS